jgi:hypothetical protein
MTLKGKYVYRRYLSGRYDPKVTSSQQVEHISPRLENGIQFPSDQCIHSKDEVRFNALRYIAVSCYDIYLVRVHPTLRVFEKVFIDKTTDFLKKYAN